MWEKDGKAMHAKIQKGDIGRYVLLPGDPFRTDLIASYLDDAKLIAHNRELKTWTGYLDGEKVSVTSTGMGCPSTAIALEELIACGADTFIRVGTAGCMNESKRNENTLGGIITASVRDEGTSRQYVPVEYPAAADIDVVLALKKAAEELNYDFPSGISYCKDSLYTLIEPENSPMGEMFKERYRIFEKANVLLTEMESSIIFILSSIRGTRAGGIAGFSDSKDVDDVIDKTIKTAVQAIRILIDEDKKEK